MNVSTQHLFIGVDGGATKCVVRLEDEAGQVLASAVGGPANMRLSVDQAWQSIDEAVNGMLQSLSIPREGKGYCYHAGMGIAGCEVVQAYQAFIKRPHIFTTLKVASDSQVACLGAHQGGDGAVIVVGTGVVGFLQQQGQVAKVGGWGFPHDDEGGGAWLGMEAVKVTLHWLDGRLPLSGLASAVYQSFNENQSNLVTWANQANSTAFAELAPLVMAQAAQGDQVAVSLLQRAACAVDQIGLALEKRQCHQETRLPCSLIGSVAPFLGPFLALHLRSRLSASLSTPEAGAILLVRQYLTSQKENK